MLVPNGQYRQRSVRQSVKMEKPGKMVIVLTTVKKTKHRFLENVSVLITIQ